MEKLSPDNKVILRQHYKSLRAAIEPDQRQLFDHAIESSVKALSEVIAAKVAFVYLSRNGEVSTRGLVQDLLEAGKTVLTPSPDITALPHDGLFRVHKEGLHGYTEPSYCAESSIEQVDLIVVPGIVWDRDGYRVGFGGGYFDRLLSMARPDCVTVGLAYSCQLLDRVPREQWDRPVNMLITEEEIFRT